MSVNTVLGEKSVSELGVTLTHEHLTLKFENFYVSPPSKLAKYLEGDITLRNVGYIRQYPYSNPTNLNFYGSEVEEAVLLDVKLYKESGGGSIVENTTHGLERNIGLSKRVSEETGVNIIAGTGHYVASVQKSSDLEQTVEQLYTTMKTELQNGCIDYPSVKCGFIGEVGSSWPIEEFEKKCIKATGEAQEELGCGVSFHPGRHHRAPEEIIRLYTEAGGRVKKAIMSHLDRTLRTNEELLEFAALGSLCQFDLFGTECSLYQLNLAQDMLSDAQRIDKVICLINDGKADKITVSHDVHTKHRLTSYGGHGYGHILNNVVPKMLVKNIEQETINTIMIKNPAEWLKCN